MSGLKHTPGPWYIHPESHIFAYRITDGADLATSMTIANVTHTRTPGTALANSRLMAAASDLRDALITARAELRALNVHQDGEQLVNTFAARAIRLAEAALSKADGDA